MRFRVLGERESGTTRLEKAATAFRAVAGGRTRERVPLDWAMTQSNLGNRRAGRPAARAANAIARPGACLAPAAERIAAGRAREIPAKHRAKHAHASGATRGCQGSLMNSSSINLEAPLMTTITPTR
jgi:hypothetical protein